MKIYRQQMICILSNDDEHTTGNSLLVALCKKSNQELFAHRLFEKTATNSDFLFAFVKRATKSEMLLAL